MPRPGSWCGRGRSKTACSGNWSPGHDLERFGRLVPLPAGSAAVRRDGPAARVIIDNGHAPGHAAVFLPGTGVLVAGMRWLIPGHGHIASGAEIRRLDADQRYLDLRASGRPFEDPRCTAEWMRACHQQRRQVITGAAEK